MNNNKTEQLLAKAIDLTRELELRKLAYDELDKVIAELKSLGFEHEVFKGMDISLVDNFAATNTQWRMAAVKRFELKVKKA